MENTVDEIVLEELLTSGSDSDSDEELFLVAESLETKTLPKVRNFVVDVLDEYDDEDFKKNLRVNRSTFEKLVTMFETSEYFPRVGHGGKPVKTAKTHIAAFLWFAGNKVVLGTVAQLFDTSISTMFHILDRVMKYIRSIGPTIIKFPTSEEGKHAAEHKFIQISGLPGIVGCIDGTCINIRTPAGKIKSTYVNRHDNTSITLQGICDSEKKFIDVFTGLSSKMHDASVFRASFIRNRLTDLEPRYIIGDAAYPISPTLITPYRDYGNVTARQRNFNLKFSQARVKIENAFGLLKGRFRQLILCEFWEVEKTLLFAICCCILHNLCIDNNDFIEEFANEEIPIREVDYPEERDAILKRLGETKRDFLAQQLEENQDVQLV